MGSLATFERGCSGRAFRCMPQQEHGQTLRLRSLTPFIVATLFVKISAAAAAAAQTVPRLPWCSGLTPDHRYLSCGNVLYCTACGTAL